MKTHRSAHARPLAAPRPLGEDALRAVNGAAADLHLRMDGVKGESTSDKHKEWIEVLSYSISASQPASAS